MNIYIKEMKVYFSILPYFHLISFTAISYNWQELRSITTW